MRPAGYKLLTSHPRSAAELEDFIGRLTDIVGVSHVVIETADMAGYLSEPRDLYHGLASCVVRPASRDEVSAILKLCHETNTSVVPQGGNTGLVGGQTPLREGTSIVLSLTRMAQVREVDVVANLMIVDAGVTLLQAQETADRAGRLFPLSLASEGSCTIGGNLATNAGGTAVIAFGNTRDLVNGLEVVMADGRVLSDLSKLKKDNTGYDLKHLFMGSEGTLGIITGAVLKLYPRPGSVEIAFLALESPQAAVDLLGRAKERFGNDIRAFELMPRLGLEFVFRHAVGQRDPLGEVHPWYALFEVTSQTREGLADDLQSFLEEAMDRGEIQDATVAASLEQGTKLWALRDLLSEVQKLEGGSIKHDVSVPLADVPAFIAEATAAVLGAIPGARPIPFGHIGDGNIHFNVTQPVSADTVEFLSSWDEVNALVHGVVLKFRGSISAEHGIGQLKRHLLTTVKDPVALDAMRAIKQALDPKGILNPGKVLGKI